MTDKKEDDYGPPVLLKSNQFWGRRSGFISHDRPKGHSTEWGPCFKLPRGGSTGGSNNNGPVGRRKSRFYPRALRAFAAQARSMGWLNGVRISRTKNEIKAQSAAQKKGNS